VAKPPTQLPISRDEQKQDDQLFTDALTLMKGVLFKRDQPYRTRVPLQGNFPTSAIGVVNVLTSCSSISSVSEWSSLAALFDEFFIHSMHWRFVPHNNLGGGVGSSVGALTTGGITATADTQINNSGMLVCSIFNAGNAYSSASAMAANATVAIKNSSKPWSYYWRNNQRFDPRGDQVVMTSFQGWTPIQSPTNYGGSIQIRMLNDVVIGSGSAVVNLGSYIVMYDVSFRARS
jgi:hypothetical protein